MHWPDSANWLPQVPTALTSAGLNHNFCTVSRSECMRRVAMLVAEVRLVLADKGLLSTLAIDHWCYAFFWVLDGRIYWYAGETKEVNPYSRHTWNSLVMAFIDRYPQERQVYHWVVTTPEAEGIVVDTIARSGCGVGVPMRTLNVAKPKGATTTSTKHLMPPTSTGLTKAQAQARYQQHQHRTQHL